MASPNEAFWDELRRQAEQLRRDIGKLRPDAERVLREAKARGITKRRRRGNLNKN